MTDMYSVEPFYVTGRYRLRPAGEFVVLQVEETTRPDKPGSDYCRWRDAAPQDLANLIAVNITPAALQVCAA